MTLLPYFLILSVALSLAYATLLHDWNQQVGNAPGIERFVTKALTETAGWARSVQDELYGEKKPTPFLLTPVVVALAVLYVLLFPIVTRLFKVIGYKKTLETGSPSSVKIRDRFERSFGGLLLAILAVAAIEAFPLLVHFFHQFRDGNVQWAFPTAAAVVAALTAANKLLPLLGGMAKKLAVVAVGAIGLLVPLLVVLFAVEFLVYADPYTGRGILTLLAVPLLLAGGVIAAMVLGIRALGGKALAKLLVLFTGMLGLFVVVGLALLSVRAEYFNLVFVLAGTAEVWLFCWLTVDVNLTSINGLYRDRLASAFLVGVDTRGDVDIEPDLDLQEICRYDAGSTAPYHLINVALNLQGSKDMAIRERNSDFFVFSKKFIGGRRTGYCRSEHMEQLFPQIDLGTAMAVSAAAASPNMGQGTNSLMVAFMTLLNVRLGFWVPNPDRVERHVAGRRTAHSDADDAPQLDFVRDVFPEELVEIARRREQAYQPGAPRPLDSRTDPAIGHNLVGIGFSGGGIRSATINLGIAQALHRRGVFDHIDYMSTVSGGSTWGRALRP